MQHHSAGFSQGDLEEPLKISQCAFVLGNIPVLPDTENRARPEPGKDVSLIIFFWNFLEVFFFKKKKKHVVGGFFCFVFLLLLLLFSLVDEGLHGFVPVVCELG